MNNEIVIICNSNQALKEISSGQWPNLHNQDVFTCNLAYTFFRTNGRHLNFMSDSGQIIDFLEQKNWAEVYYMLKYEKVEHVIALWDLRTKGLYTQQTEQCKAIINYSPIEVPASSAINALMYLAEVENYQTIYLLGYTLNEWQGISAVKELQSKKQALENLLNKYSVTKERDFVFKYVRK